VEDLLAAVASPAVSPRPLEKPAAAVGAVALLDSVVGGPALVAPWAGASPLPCRPPLVAEPLASSPSSPLQPPHLDDIVLFPPLPSFQLQGLGWAVDESLSRSSVVGNLAPASAPSSPRAVQVGALLVPLQQISAPPVSAPPPPSPRALGFAPNPSTARAFGPAHPLEAQSARSNLSSSEASSDGRHVVISSHHTAVEQVGFDTSKTYLLSPTLLLLFCL
jgi:hypothetical protein